MEKEFKAHIITGRSSGDGGLVGGGRIVLACACCQGLSISIYHGSHNILYSLYLIESFSLVLFIVY